MDVTEGTVEPKKKFKKFDLVVVTEAFGLTRDMMKAGGCGISFWYRRIGWE
jgi:hypothetical protein